MDEARNVILIAGFALSIAAILLTAGGLIYQLRKVTTDVEQVNKDMIELTKQVTTHIGDHDAHVNHLYMKHLDDSIKEIKQGNKEMNLKMDRMMEKLMESHVLKHIN